MATLTTFFGRTKPDLIADEATCMKNTKHAQMTIKGGQFQSWCACFPFEFQYAAEKFI
jgi:hypothetical protein